jgi:hypothetical protein
MNGPITPTMRKMMNTTAPTTRDARPRRRKRGTNRIRRMAKSLGIFNPGIERGVEQIHTEVE